MREPPNLTALVAPMHQTARHEGSAHFALQASWPGGDRSWALAKGRLSLGRDPTCDIVIDLGVVSRRHAMLEHLGDRIRLTDADSLNGLYLDGRRIGTAELRGGEVVRISDGLGVAVSLRFSRADQRRSAGEDLARLDLGPGKRIALIGRDPMCDICLDHGSVSRRHARIERRADGHILIDTGSTNGTFVEGYGVSTYRLIPGNRVFVGPFVLAYDGAGVVWRRSASTTGVAINVEGLFKTVTGGWRWTPWPTRERPVLLRDIVLSIHPNEFLALLGGSGTGKSTLLRALCGADPGTRWARGEDGPFVRDRERGPVEANGLDLYAHFDFFRPWFGYVPQSDIIHGSLTVAAAMEYAAMLRLPADTPADERRKQIRMVLKRIGMMESGDTVIAKLSGGQRKRINTAVELLANPRIIFLDEPTSGLDPGLDETIMRSLRELARDGRTVLLVTHTVNSIELCDRVVFLAPGGQLAFCGPPEQALAFFGTDKYAGIYRAIDSNPAHWVRLFRESDLWSRQTGANADDSAAALIPPVQRSRTAGLIRIRRQGISPARQLYVLARRYSELMVRDLRNLTILLAQAPAVAIVLALVSRSDVLVPGPPDNALKAQPVLNTLAIVAVWFGVSNAAREITKESALYEREHLSGIGALPYVLSKVIVLALLCVLQVAFLLAVLFRVGVPSEGLVVGPAADIYITLLLAALAGMGTGLLLSSMVANEDRAMSFTPIILVPQLILSGVSFKLSGIGEIFSYLTISYWSTHALGSIVDICGMSPGGVCDPERINLAYDHSVGALARDWAVLAAYGLAFLGLTVKAMQAKDKLRGKR